MSSAAWHRSELSHSNCSWNTCCDECDGFNCQFSCEDDLPLSLLTCLGHGGAGVVTKVQTRDKTLYARKVIRWYGRKKLLQEVQEEVRILRELRHAHIVQIKGSYVVGRASFGLLMEPVADCDLAIFLGTFDTDTPWSLATQEARVTLSNGFGCLSSGLAFIHGKEIKHQDIKPQNILVHRGRLLYTDFGIAKDFSSFGVSGSTGPISCTRRYAAPEVVGYDGLPHGRAADVYSLGCVFSEMMTIIGLKSMEEMMDFTNQDVLHKTLDLLQGWLDELRSVLSQGFADFISCISRMIDESATNRPTAREVLHCTTQGRIDIEIPLCGTCCAGSGGDTETLDQSLFQSFHRISNTQLHEIGVAHPPSWEVGSSTTSISHDFEIRPNYQSNPSSIHHLQASLANFDLNRSEGSCERERQSTRVMPLTDPLRGDHGVPEPLFPLPPSGADSVIIRQIIHGQEYEITVKRSQTAGNPQYASSESVDTPSIALPTWDTKNGLYMHQNTRQKKAGYQRKRFHLDSEVAARARQLRAEGSCWICCLQRDSCTLGAVCERCEKRGMPASLSSTYNLGCDRTKLIDLKVELLPSIIILYHGSIASDECWSGVTWAEKILPAHQAPTWTWAGLSTGPQVKINDNLATVTSHPWLQDSGKVRYFACPTFKREHVSGISASPAYSRVLDASEIARGFGARDAQDISWKLFKLLGRMYQEKTDHNTKQLTTKVIELLYSTYKLTHELEISSGHEVVFGMSQGKDVPASAGGKVSLTLLTMQVKSALIALYEQTLVDVLGMLQRRLRSSRSIDSSIAFIMIALALICERIQAYLLDLMSSSWRNSFSVSEVQRACEAIDERYNFLTSLFRLKYGRLTAKYQQMLKSPNLPAASEMDAIFCGMIDLTRENLEYLEARRTVTLDITNTDPFRMRLVARLLLALYE